MALIICSECSKEISSKAVFCPSCGKPLPNLMSSFSKPEFIDIKDVLSFVDTSAKPDSCKRINGTGTTFGGYISLLGYPNFGFIKKYFSIAFIPLIPIGTYLVKDWDGTSGAFIGEISSENASKFVGKGRQTLAVILGAVGTVLVIAVSIVIVGFIFNATR